MEKHRNSRHRHGMVRDQNARRTVNRILKIQLVAIVIVSAASLVFGGVQAAYSAVVGGGIGVITTASFAGVVLSTRYGLSAAGIARRFYLGEVIKIALTVVLFSMAFAWLDSSFLPLFMAYMATLLAYWLVLPSFL